MNTQKTIYEMNEVLSPHSHVIADESQRKEVVNGSSANHNQDTDCCNKVGNQRLLFGCVDVIFDHLIAIGMSRTLDLLKELINNRKDGDHGHDDAKKESKQDRFDSERDRNREVEFRREVVQEDSASSLRFEGENREINVANENSQNGREDGVLEHLQKDNPSKVCGFHC